MKFDFGDRSPIRFRKLTYDDGLLGFIEHEFKVVDYELEVSAHTLDRLTGISRESSKQIRLRARKIFAQDRVNDFINDEDNSRPLETMLTVCGLAGAFAFTILDSPERMLAVLIILSSFLLLLLILIMYVIRNSRRRKALDVLSLVITDANANLIVIENASEEGK